MGATKNRDPAGIGLACTLSEAPSVSICGIAGPDCPPAAGAFLASAASIASMTRCVTPEFRSLVDGLGRSIEGSIAGRYDANDALSAEARFTKSKISSLVSGLVTWGSVAWGLVAWA